MKILSSFIVNKPEMQRVEVEKVGFWVVLDPFDFDFMRFKRLNYSSRKFYWFEGE